MLSTTARPLIEATVPVLLANGEAITRHFYGRMFGAHPELKNLFNLGNQATGDQAQALAGAVYAFAAHMDKPAVIGPVLDRIAHKHVSLGITPAQYTIVGRHLLAAIGEVLGDAITADIATAWDEVYWLMATELVAREARLYQERDWQAGQDWPQLEVVARDMASADTVALTLKSADGTPLPSFVPGQYLSVAIPVPEAGLTQVRQYSLSDAPGDDTWRITVKRVAAGDATPAGVVSNRLHDTIRVGDTLRAGPPAGDFRLRDGDHPVVLISAGVGITPMVSMLRHLALTRPARPVVFAHATQDISRYSHQHEVETSLANLDEGRYHLWLEAPAAHDAHAFPGRMDLSRIEALPDDGDFYLCGPLPFMQTQRRWLLGAGIPRERIHYEVFGPDLFGELQ
ncbi:globin domain-containing protein [Zoogloea sp.]|uniref:globin domain-containing protein n=1 Tax=Zoogloea sp. TaxID=49181 RepID=UPI001AD1DE9A|nr:globin domain-containing protein [Zoogloea sp.]MBN8282199.1 nitric oxide dioxygenase [Zoogloea sp.]